MTVSMPVTDGNHSEHAGGEAEGLRQGLKRLKAAGFRLTPQRRAILEFFQGGCGHLTPQQVYAQLVSTVPSLSLATVYNTLEVLVDVGLITRVHAHDGQTYFDSTSTPHHHAVCDGCGAIFDVFLPAQTLETLAWCVHDSAGGESSDFEIRRANVWLRGLCKSCH